MKKQYTLTIYTEGQIQLINKITLIFLRRQIKIESLNFSCCEIDKMFRFTIVVSETVEVIQNLVLQIEKIIDVYKCYYSTNEQIIWKQVALYKIKTSVIAKKKVKQLSSLFDVKAISTEEDYTIYQAIGKEEDINHLVDEFSKFDLIEFIKSSRIAIIKTSEGFQKELQEI
ncbi:acetolactate synthase small subunit [Flavobacterium sp. T12S277]|uniref:acetolactate synthase small subunit n=1 Tax=Flavobacterium sp. T12S277 TaxID=3402752 RepID=UPI003ADCE7E6